MTKVAKRILRTFIVLSAISLSASWSAAQTNGTGNHRVNPAEIEDISAEELSSSEVKKIETQKKYEELNESQARAIVDIYEDNPDQFIIVEEEIVEEDGTNADVEMQTEVVKEIQYQNFRIELATVGTGKELGDAQLTEESKERLTKVSNLLNAYPEFWKSASIHGYSNLYDNSQANMELSHRRAFMAHHFLSQNGVDQRKVMLRAFSRKKGQEDDQNAYLRNRLVFLYVNSVLDGTPLARELKKLEDQPIALTIIQPLAMKTKVIYKDKIVYKEAKPKVIYKDKIVYRQAKPKIFKVSIEGIGSNFKTADDALNTGARERLKRLAILLDTHGGQWKDIAVHGHTDERGGYKYNINLSARRAQSVLEVLQHEGVDSNRISSKAFGYTRPLVKRSDPLGWQKNRRVEVLISGVVEGTPLEKALRQLIIPKKVAVQ